MKKFLLLFLQILLVNQISAQKVKSDLQKMNLKGKVNTITEVEKRCPSVIAEDGEFNCRKDTIVYAFNIKGNLLKNTSDDDQDMVKTIVNGLVYKTRYEMVKEVKKKSAEDIYNSKGQLVTQKRYYLYSDEERLTDQWDYVYDKNGQKTEEKATEWWNGNKKTNVSTFNKFGDLVKRQTFRNEQLENEEEYDLAYKTDKYGNWITKNSSGGHYIQDWTRKITYFKN